MKKEILYLTLLVLFINCQNKDSVKEEIICMNTPPAMSIIIMNNEMETNKLVRSFYNAKQTAVLYRVENDKKSEIGKFAFANNNVMIGGAGEGLKSFFTENLETFCLEYDNKTDTLQIKGYYYKTENCGDTAYLTELHFNHKKVDLRTSLIGDNIYKIDNTK